LTERKKKDFPSVLLNIRKDTTRRPGGEKGGQKEGNYTEEIGQ